MTYYCKPVMKLNANESEQFSFTTLYDELPQSFCHEKTKRIDISFYYYKTCN